MTAEIVWLPKAEEDIIDIYVAIGRHQPQVADAYFNRLQTRIESLRAHPRLGKRRPDIAATLRMLVETPFVVLYRTVPDGDEDAVASVEIVRILDARRNLEDAPLSGRFNPKTDANRIEDPEGPLPLRGCKALARFCLSPYFTVQITRRPGHEPETQHLTPR